MPGVFRNSVSQESARRAQQLVDTFRHPLFVADRAGNVLMSNNATPLAIGVSLNDFLVSNVQDCVKRGYYDISVARAAAETRQQVSRILTTRLGLVFVANGTPIFGDAGQVQLAVMSAVPIREYDKRRSSLIEADASERQQQLQALFGGLIAGDDIVAESQAMRGVMQTAAAVAPSDSPVMITGETGTGKEVIARHIHALSGRSHRPFVPVNVAALPETLFEAELFGYARGAFTGAKEEGHAGLFATADGGTLFLDEIGDLPPAAQAKLLRVLDSGEVRRLGSSSVIKVDVRIVAATHKNLQQMVRDNQFRADLFYRLNTLPIELPPLRERPEDVLALAEKFRRDACRKNGIEVVVDAVTLAAWTKAAWPGNARELRSAVERYILMARAQRHHAAFREVEEPTSGYADILRLFELNAPLKDVLSRVEEDYVRYMLHLCGGRVGVTASKLGIYRTVLYRKLKAYRNLRKRLS
jgi:transcriptional regulator with PAS, ATPase and Fis domain